MSRSVLEAQFSMYKSQGFIVADPGVKPMGGSPRKTRKVAKQEVKVAGYSVIDPSAPVESADQRRRGGARLPSLGPKSVRVRVQQDRASSHTVKPALSQRYRI